MTTEINGLNYYYKDKGKGKEIILLLHGNPDSSDMWEGIFPFLEKEYRCIAPDLPGFGRSEIERKPQFSLEKGAHWLNAFISNLLITDPVHIILHDVGAFYGIPWAIKHPELVKSLCISNTLFFSNYSWHFWGRVWRTPILGEIATIFTTKSLFKREMLKGGPGLSNDYLEKAFAKLTPQMKKTVLNMYRYMDPLIFKGWELAYEKLAGEVPIQVIWGDLDPYIPLRFGYAERFAQSQNLLHVPGAGHWVAAEKPELFAKTWLTFIQN